MLWILIFDALLYCTAENRPVNDRDWNRHLATPISCPVEAVQILLKSLEDSSYDATRFSWPHRPAILHNFLCWLLFFGQHYIKSLLGDSNNTYKKYLCVVESAFIFSFSPLPRLSQYHGPSAHSKSLSLCRVKTLQYRVRKCAHEGRLRVTNRSRVNPITMQCKVGKCYRVAEKYDMGCRQEPITYGLQVVCSICNRVWCGSIFFLISQSPKALT